MRILPILLLTLALDPAVSAQPAVRSDSIFSPALGRSKGFIIILPPGYDRTSRYPVVYLLHGLGANPDMWLKRTSLERYARDYPYIFVMPDAADSWYVNSLTNPSDRYEDYLTRDLPAWLRAHYAIDTSRQALVGFSMGGYGALVLALRHPSEYWFTGDMSGGLDIPANISRLEANGRAWIIPSVTKAFGAESTAGRSRYDPFKLFRSAPPGSLPYVYMVTGIQEEFTGRITLHRQFADSLRAYGAAYEYHETPGKHTFEFWDKELPLILRRMKEIMEKGKSVGESNW